jgi:hypothetical protein
MQNEIGNWQEQQQLRERECKSAPGSCPTQPGSSAWRVKAGLLCSKSQGKVPVVWLGSAARTLRAAAHVVRRHGGCIEQVVVLEVTVPRAWLRRSKKGLWYGPRDVPPGRIRGVIAFGELSRSPVEETAARAR